MLIRVSYLRMSNAASQLGGVVNDYISKMGRSRSVGLFQDRDVELEERGLVDRPATSGMVDGVGAGRVRLSARSVIRFGAQEGCISSFINACINSGFEHPFSYTHLVRVHQLSSGVEYEEIGNLAALNERDRYDIEQGMFLYSGEYSIRMNEEGKLVPVGIILLGTQDKGLLEGAQLEKAFGKVQDGELGWASDESE